MDMDIRIESRTQLRTAATPRWALLRAMGWTSGTPPTADEAASTLFRFFRSKHVTDLRVVVRAAILAALACIALVVFEVVCEMKGMHTQAMTAVKDLQLYVGPVLTLSGVVIAWAYRSASARLGVVDLFACEISTLCRVGSVFDIGQVYADRFREAAAPQPTHAAAALSGPNTFVSQEHYFPVFDGNSRDLQLLEARVVNNVVEFYTYMKAMRDVMRRLAQIEAAAASAGAAAAPTQGVPNPRQSALGDVLYMIFLAYESARRAIRDLIEFEPFEAEATMIILLTELKSYAFLLGRFPPGDLRHARLELRKAGYRAEADRLREVVRRHGGDDEHWLAARRTAPEIERLFDLALHETGVGQEPAKR